MLLACSKKQGQGDNRMKQAAAAFATAASTRTRMCENEGPAWAAKESGDESAKSWDDG
jgi:hypothetical protein